MASRVFEAVDFRIPLDVAAKIADIAAGQPRYARAAAKPASKPAGTPIRCPNCAITGELAPGAKAPVTCPSCGVQFDPATGKIAQPGLAASVRLDRMVKAIRQQDPTVSYENAVRRLTRRVVGALALVALLSAGALRGDTVTLLSASTATGASPAVHSTAMGAAGGLDEWQFQLTPSGATWTRLAQLQESLDGVFWAKIDLFRAPTYQIVVRECGPCFFRIYVAGNPAGTQLTATATSSGSLVPEVVAP